VLETAATENDPNADDEPYLPPPPSYYDHLKEALA